MVHRCGAITEDVSRSQLLSVRRLEQFESNLFSSINIILMNFISSVLLFLIF